MWDTWARADQDLPIPMGGRLPIYLFRSTFDDAPFVSKTRLVVGGNARRFRGIVLQGPSRRGQEPDWRQTRPFFDNLWPVAARNRCRRRELPEHTDIVPPDSHAS